MPKRYYGWHRQSGMQRPRTSLYRLKKIKINEAPCQQQEQQSEATQNQEIENKRVEDIIDVEYLKI